MHDTNRYQDARLFLYIGREITPTGLCGLSGPISPIRGGGGGGGGGGGVSRGQPPQDSSVGSGVVWVAGLFSLWPNDFILAQLTRCLNVSMRWYTPASPMTLWSPGILGPVSALRCRLTWIWIPIIKMRRSSKTGPWHWRIVCLSLLRSTNQYVKCRIAVMSFMQRLLCLQC